MINGLLIERGEATNILRSLLQSAIYYLPSYMCVDVSEVIYELLLLARPAVCIALENVLQVRSSYKLWEVVYMRLLSNST